MKTLSLIAIPMFLLMTGCQSVVHRLSTGDRDGGPNDLEVRPDRIALIIPGKTSRKEVLQILNRPVTQQMTYRHPFLVTYQGQHFPIDQKMYFHYTIYTPPEHYPNMSVYSWYEQRAVSVYLKNDIVQIVLIDQTFNDPGSKHYRTGSIQNYDDSLFNIERMNGFGCARQIFDVVSLGERPRDEIEYYRFCEPLILKPTD